jgi:WS/DGAT/MGAT family acyltransferase
VIWRPRRGLGGPLWTDARDFDIRNHIRIASLAGDADEADLLEAIEQLRRKPLARSRPLWELWLLPGLPERRVALFLRFHHAVADGRAAMTMLAAFLDLQANASRRQLPVWAPKPVPTPLQLLVDRLAWFSRNLIRLPARFAHPRSAFDNVRAVIVQLRELVGEGPASDTSLNRLIGRRRRFALLSFRLADVKTAGHVHRATPNDVVLALTTAGLRAVLASRGERLERLRVRAYAPVSLRRRMRGTVQGNWISMMVVHLPVGDPDPSTRLRRLAAETTGSKSLPRASMGAWFRPPILRRVLLKLFAGQRVNTVVTTVHGPRRTLYVAGAPVLQIVPLLNLFGNQTLGVGAVSYAERLFVGITADYDTFPDIDILASSMSEEFRALSTASQSATIPSRAAA